MIYALSIRLTCHCSPGQWETVDSKGEFFDCSFQLFCNGLGQTFSRPWVFFRDRGERISFSFRNAFSFTFSTSTSSPLSCHLTVFFPNASCDLIASNLWHHCPAAVSFFPKSPVGHPQQVFQHPPCRAVAIPSFLDIFLFLSCFPVFEVALGLSGRLNSVLVNFFPGDIFSVIWVSFCISLLWEFSSNITNYFAFVVINLIKKENRLNRERNL